MLRGQTGSHSLPVCLPLALPLSSLPLLRSTDIFDRRMIRGCSCDLYFLLIIQVAALLKRWANSKQTRSVPLPPSLSHGVLESKCRETRRLHPLYIDLQDTPLAACAVTAGRPRRGRPRGQGPSPRAKSSERAEQSDRIGGRIRRRRDGECRPSFLVRRLFASSLSLSLSPLPPFCSRRRMISSSIRAASSYYFAVARARPPSASAPGGMSLAKRNVFSGK